MVIHFKIFFFIKLIIWSYVFPSTHCLSCTPWILIFLNYRLISLCVFFASLLKTYRLLRKSIALFSNVCDRSMTGAPPSLLENRLSKEHGWHLRARAHVSFSLIRKCFPENTLSVTFYKRPEQICFKAFFNRKKWSYHLLSTKTIKPWISCRSKALESILCKSIKLVDEETEAKRKKRWILLIGFP